MAGSSASSHPAGCANTGCMAGFRLLFVDFRIGLMLVILPIGALVALIGQQWVGVVSCIVGLGVAIKLARWLEKEQARSAWRSDAWPLLEAARPVLLDHFGPDGVDRVEFEAAYPVGDALSVWLCTATDEQKAALGGSHPRREEVFDILVGVGFEPSQLVELGTGVQSQQTVDRDFGGVWRQALR